MGVFTFRQLFQLVMEKKNSLDIDVYACIDKHSRAMTPCQRFSMGIPFSDEGPGEQKAH